VGRPSNDVVIITRDVLLSICSARYATRLARKATLHKPVFSGEKRREVGKPLGTSVFALHVFFTSARYSCLRKIRKVKLFTKLLLCLLLFSKFNRHYTYPIFQTSIFMLFTFLILMLDSNYENFNLLNVIANIFLKNSA